MLQGALELESATWDAPAKTIQGVSLGPPGTAHQVAVYVPEARRWVQGGPFLALDFPGYTVKVLNEHILRIRVRFDQTNRVAWEVELDRFVARR